MASVGLVHRSYKNAEFVSIQSICFDTLDAVTHPIIDHSVSIDYTYDTDEITPYHTLIAAQIRDLQEDLTRLYSMRRYDSIYANVERPTKQDALRELRAICMMLPVQVVNEFWGWISLDILCDVLRDYIKLMRAKLDRRKETNDLRLDKARRRRLNKLYAHDDIVHIETLVKKVRVKKRVRAVFNAKKWPTWAAQEGRNDIASQSIDRYKQHEARTSRYYYQDKRLKELDEHHIKEDKEDIHTRTNLIIANNITVYTLYKM